MQAVDPDLPGQRLFYLRPAWKRLCSSEPGCCRVCCCRFMSNRLAAGERQVYQLSKNTDLITPAGRVFTGDFWVNLFCIQSGAKDQFRKYRPVAV